MDRLEAIRSRGRPVICRRVGGAVLNTGGDDSVVTIPLDHAVAIFRDLECFVVSLDRISSREASGEAGPEMLHQFIYDWLVGYRLARARGVLGDAVAEVIGEAAIE